MTDKIRLDVDGPIATITNDNPDKHNAFDDEMDAALFAILDELRTRPDVRAVIWRGEGKSWSSGRDVAAIGTNRTELTPPRADAARPRRDPAALGPRRPGDRGDPGLGDRRLVPAGAAVRHPHRRRRRQVHAARARARRDPRHGRRERAVRDVRPRPRERHGADRTAARRRGGAAPRHRQPGRAARRARRHRCGRWPRRSPARRRSR